MLKQPKVRSEKHRRFIASLPCWVTGREGGTQAAHIRVENNAGLGLKSGDDCCLPLHWEVHRAQHSQSEKNFWGGRLEHAQWLAKELYANTGNTEACLKLIDQFRWKCLGVK
jgi:hypothetical protein